MFLCPIMPQGLTFKTNLFIENWPYSLYQGKNSKDFVVFDRKLNQIYQWFYCVKHFLKFSSKFCCNFKLEINWSNINYFNAPIRRTSSLFLINVSFFHLTNFDSIHIFCFFYTISKLKSNCKNWIASFNQTLKWNYGEQDNNKRIHRMIFVFRKRTCQLFYIWNPYIYAVKIWRCR